MEEIIVTGSTGFIGRRLIRELIKIYPVDKILCLIKDETNDLEISGRKILSELKIKTKFIDLLTGKGLEDLPQSPKIIFHLAASTESADKDHRCNDKGTKNLLDAFPDPDKNLKFIFISTTAIFSGRKDLDKMISESTIPFPSNEYGRTKLAAEKIVIDYCFDKGVQCIILRLSTVWGEGTRKNGLFDKMDSLIEKNSIIPRLDWKGKTSLIYVEDVVKVIILLGQTIDQTNLRTYILSSEVLTLAQISETIHVKKNLRYKQIRLPGILWNIMEKITAKSIYFENYLPYRIYNIFWRLNLILVDSLSCMPGEISRKFPEMNIKKNIKLKKFKNNI